MSNMSNHHTVEVFAAGCSACQDVIDLVQRIASPGSTITVLDMKDAAVAQRAKALGIRSVPSVVVDGTLASCCAARGIDEESLRRELA